MDAATWQQVAAVAEQAIALSEPERNAFLERAVAENPSIANDIRAVVAAAADPDDFAESLSDRIGPILDKESFVRGEHFGPYKIANTLGWGGMGAVYLAHRDDEQFDKTVALKVLPTLTETGASRERFLRERQLLASLEHPSIARLLDGGVTEFDQPYFVLEYVRGATASQFADAATTTLGEVLAVFVQACDAVAYAHSKLVVHCDLKPSNVMVDDDGRARLIDFGISRLISEEPLSVRLDYLETPLTRNYASPELLARQGVDTRSDVYSLGNLLYRLLTGKQRYQIEDGNDALKAISAHEAIAEMPAVGKLSSASIVQRRELAAIVSRATEADRQDRYQSVAQLRGDVNSVVSGDALVPPPAVRGYRLRKLIRQNPVASALSLATAIAVIAALVILFVALATTRGQRAAARAAEADALEAARISEAVVDFLVSVFGNADPSSAEENGNANARDLVETGLRLADEQPVAGAQFSARLDLAMGRAGVGVGAFDSAKAALLRALDGPLSVGDQRIARLHLLLVYAGLGDNSNLESLLGELLGECEAAADSQCLVAAYRARGHWQTLANKREEAAESYRTALSHIPKSEATTREKTALRATTLFNLGSALHGGHQFAEAGPVFAEAMELHRAIGGPPTLESAQAFAMLGTFKNAMGEFPEAKELLTKARELLVRLRGAFHVDVAQVEYVLSRVVQELGERERALELADASLVTRKARLGDDSLQASFSLARRADALLALDRLEEAEVSLENARSISRTLRPRSHARQSLLLARIYIAQKRPTEAVKVAKQALATQVAELGERHRALGDSRMRLAKVLLAAAEPRAALVELRVAQELSASLRADHPRHSILLLRVARAHRELGELEEAERVIIKAAELAADVSPPRPSLVRDVASEKDVIARARSEKRAEH